MDVEGGRKEVPLVGTEKEIHPLMDFRNNKTPMPAQDLAQQVKVEDQVQKVTEEVPVQKVRAEVQTRHPV